MDIENFIIAKRNNHLDSRSVFFDLSKKMHHSSLEILAKAHKNCQVIDDYKEQLKEYFQVKNPALVFRPEFDAKFADFMKKIELKTPLWQQGKWVYFSWFNTLVHILTEKEFNVVRTARNKNLINEKEQSIFYKAVVGVAGLSVGNSAALAIILQGGAKRIKLADHDRFALSNINRIRTGVENLGLPKIEMTAREIYTINPYAKIEIFPEGLNENNIKKFFVGPPKLDIIVDEIDNLGVKYLIREWSRKLKIAVVMAADNGDNGVVDIERYDQKPNTKFFHGRMGKMRYHDLLNLKKLDIGKTITQYVGPENVTPRMQESMLQIGKKIVSWPQLGGAALMNGSAIAYCVRKILNKQPLVDGRVILSFDEKFIPGFNSRAQKNKRRIKTGNFKKSFGLK